MMNALSLIRKIHWTGNKRTIRTEHRIPDHVLNQVRAFRDEGQYEDAIALLEEQDKRVMSGDNIALINLALARFGIGDYSGAHEALDRTEQALLDAQAAVLINRANIFKVEGEYEAALEAAYKAREIAPDRSASHLALIAVLEARQSPDDAAEVEQAAEIMRRAWASFEHYGDDPRSYLNDDMDFADLRKDPLRFERLFGYSPPGYAPSLEAEH